MKLFYGLLQDNSRMKKYVNVFLLLVLSTGHGILCGTVEGEEIIINLNGRTNYSLSTAIRLNLSAGTYRGEAYAGKYIAWSKWSQSYGYPVKSDGSCRYGWQTYVTAYSSSKGNFRPFISKRGIERAWSTAQLALSYTEPTTFTLLTAEQVRFYLDDSANSDNRGGMSIRLIRQADNTVININAALYGDPGAGLNTLKVPFSKGYYVSTFINPSMDSRALYTAWSAWSEGDSWYSYYGIKVDQITFAGGDHAGGSSPETVFDLVEPKTISFYVPQDMDVEFYIGDNDIEDNRGGVSLLIKKTLPGDMNGDLVVDFGDIAVFSNAWLSSNGVPSFNWRCDTTFDNVVDANDLSALTLDWLEDVLL